MNQDDCTAGLRPERCYLDSGAVRLSYLHWGSTGPTLVLLHGITSSAATLWRVAPTLAQAGYQVYAFDMPGHGESGDTDDHSIDAIAALVGDALAALGLQEVTLIGHSWGGATAIAFASAASAARSRLQRVVLIDPALAMEATRGAELLPAYAEHVGEPATDVRLTLRANNPDWHECDIFWKGVALEQCRMAAVTGFFTQSGDWNLTPCLASVAVPLLLLVADPQFTVVSPALLAEAEHAIRTDATIVIVPGTNHNMFRGGFIPTMETLTAWLVKTKSS